MAPFEHWVWVYSYGITHTVWIILYESFCILYVTRRQICDLCSTLKRYLRSSFGKLWVAQIFFLDAMNFSTVLSKTKLRARFSGRSCISFLHSGQFHGIGLILVKHSWQKVCPQGVMRMGFLKKSRHNGHLNSSSIFDFSLLSDLDNRSWIAYQKGK